MRGNQTRGLEEGGEVEERDPNKEAGTMFKAVWPSKGDLEIRCKNWDKVGSFQDKINFSLCKCTRERCNSEADEKRASEKVGGKSLEHRQQEGQAGLRRGWGGDSADACSVASVLSMK